MCINAHVVSNYHDKLRLKASEILNMLGEEGYSSDEIQEIANNMAEIAGDGSY